MGKRLITLAILIAPTILWGQDIPTGIKSLLDKHLCTTCHQLDAKLIGPSFYELAEKGQSDKEVAALIAEGLSNKEIAAKLHIALGTVKDHVHNMLEKTGLANRTAIATAHRAFAKLPPAGDDVNPSSDRK